MSQLDAVVLNEVKKTQKLITESQSTSSGGTFNAVAPIVFPKKVGEAIRKGYPISINTHTGEVQEGASGSNGVYGTSNIGNADNAGLRASMLNLNNGTFIVCDSQQVANGTESRIKIVDRLGALVRELPIMTGATYGALCQFYRFSDDLILIGKHNRARGLSMGTSHIAYWVVYSISSGTYSPIKTMTNQYGWSVFFEYGGDRFMIPSQSNGTPLRITADIVAGLTLTDAGLGVFNTVYFPFAKITSVSNTLHKFNRENTGGYCFMSDGTLLVAHGTNSGQITILDFINNTGSTTYVVPPHPGIVTANLPIHSIHAVGENLVLVGFLVNTSLISLGLYEYASGTLTPAGPATSIPVTGNSIATTYYSGISGIKVAAGRYIIGGASVTPFKLYDIRIDLGAKSVTEVSTIAGGTAYTSLLDIDLDTMELYGGGADVLAQINMAFPIELNDFGIRSRPMIFIGYADADVDALYDSCPVRILPTHIAYVAAKKQITHIGDIAIYNITEDIAFPIYIPAELEFYLAPEAQVDAPITKPIQQSTGISTAADAVAASGPSLATTASKIIQYTDVSIGIAINLGGGSTAYVAFLPLSSGNYIRVSRGTQFTATHIKLHPGEAIQLIPGLTDSFLVLGGVMQPSDYSTFNFAIS